MCAHMLNVALNFRPNHQIQVMLGQVGQLISAMAGAWVELLAKREGQFLSRVVLAPNKKTKTAPN